GWDHLWDNHPVAAAMGLTWWGANAIGNAFGYSDYSNPYYSDSGSAVYSEPCYAMPIEPAAETATTTTAAASPLPPGVSQDTISQFDQGRAAFYEGKYDEALKLTDAAMTQMPRDAVLHEFRALVLFALRRYTEAAATLHPVLDVGPGWDWKTMCSL